MTRPRRWAWRGDESDETRAPRRLSEALSELSGRLRIDDPVVIARLAQDWPGAVGEAVAEHTRPRALQDGILVIEADTPEWATQLRFLERELLERIGAVAGGGAVTGLRIVIRRG